MSAARRARVALLLAGLAGLAVTRLRSQPAAKAPEFKQYFLTLLYAGPNRGGTPAEIERIQKAHLDNIARLVREGKLAIAGPFEDGGDLRGIFIFDVPTKAEAEALTASDPAIRAGRLRAETFTWWSERGRTLP